MISISKTKGWTIKFLVMMGLWTIIILLISLMTLFSSLQQEMSIGVVEAIIFEFWCITPWIVLTPAVIRLARTYPFEYPVMYKSLGVHLAAATLLFSLHCLVQSYTVSIYYDDISFGWPYLKRDFLGFIDMRLMLYVGILLAVYSLDFYRKNQKIQLKEPQLKAELNRARFHAILNQIQPDFLLNSIESIKKSLNESQEEAEEILTEFSDLLRIMLANIEREEVTIREDLESYFLYTELLQKRLGQRIQIESNIDDECYDDLIPPFLVVIPVLEEVVCTLEKGRGRMDRISYNAHHVNGRINLEAVIEGKNILSDELSHILKKIGIIEVIERLEERFEENIQLITKGQRHRIRMSIALPYRKAPADYEMVPTVRDWLFNN